MVGIASTRKDRLTDDMIVQYVRHFQPLTTTQIQVHFGFSGHGVASRLRRIAGLCSEKRDHRTIVWRAV